MNFDLTFSFIEEGDAFLFENLPKLSDFYVNESSHPGMEELKKKFNESFQINGNEFQVPNDITPLKKKSIVVKTPKKISVFAKRKQDVEIDFCGHIFSPGKQQKGKLANRINRNSAISCRGFDLEIYLKKFIQKNK
jgi:hypothetical protein